MSYSTVRILNIDFLSITTEQLLHDLKEGVLITPNVDHLMKLQHDAAFYEVYKKAEWVVCDSRIIQIMSRCLPHPLPMAIPGSSFFTAFYMHHRDDADCKIFILGAKEGVATEAMKRINAKVGRNIVVGAHSPSYGFENKEEECRQIVDIINAACPSVLLIGVGAPKQEKWIMKYKSRLNSVRLFMALGATIDFEAGNVKRAPKIMQKCAMEWLYRMFCDPKRLIKRYLVDDLPFFFIFAKQLLGHYKNPFKQRG